jgi:hypothetical protein
MTLGAGTTGAAGDTFGDAVPAAVAAQDSPCGDTVVAAGANPDNKSNSDIKTITTSDAELETDADTAGTAESDTFSPSGLNHDCFSLSLY